MVSIYRRALDDLAAVFTRIDESEVDRAVAAIAAAGRIALYGVGREGLQIKGLAMRLHHLGRSASVVGDMNTPPLGRGDLLIVSAGPGYFSTVAALMKTASEAGAQTLCVTAQPGGACPLAADVVLTIPAQTMADDSGPSTSVLPMGSLFEGAQYVLFECLILKLREALKVSPEAMRANHTNLE
ncbi:Hexulose-6-phosphate isomerase [uncultured Pleomorphomonas sp.]|uniref:Hexulose-6-phosphate isomerase n=1 Tax=uncultured Pleomorphomonas sp. TaxID=442121 RepID=A0A212L331_9HYPH|nr:SIS domain-containing protein [uncultured Pleomorphomonas sp.]SCM71887.1 Hexulose-6-phosphate isomerase [uncultured Pleomorphomonas sp.]